MIFKWLFLFWYYMDAALAPSSSTLVCTRTLIISILLSGIILISYIYLPASLDYRAWSLSVIFVITLALAISKVFETGIVALVAISLSLITSTLTLEQCLSKFSHHVSWLILMAFFISRGIIASGLAKRIALNLASFLGTTPLRLSYSLIAAESFIAPFIPSNTARGAGLIYPIAQSLCVELYSNKGECGSSAGGNNSDKSKSPEAFLLFNCFQANIITSTMFLTAMAGNPVIAGFSASYNYDLTWSKWFIFALLPGLICLLVLPYLHFYLLNKPKFSQYEFDDSIIKGHLRGIGAISKNEILMSLTFMMLLVSWVCLGSIIHPTAAAIIAVTFLLATKVLTWNDVISDKSAWTTFLWLTTLLMLSTYLKEFGVIDFVAYSLAGNIPFSNPFIVLIFLIVINFFSHYMFASLTAHATTLLPTFIVIGLSFDIPTAPLILSLAYSTPLSAGLTHYGTGSAPIFFNAGYWSIKQWWVLGFIHSVVFLLIFSCCGLPLWWHLA